MKHFPSVDRVDIDMDFGGGIRPMGSAAIAKGVVYLQFDSNFVGRGINPSPLKLELTTRLQKGVPDLGGLPGLLHDSLPDGWSRLVLDRYLRTQGFDHTSLSSLDRLALVGHGGAGALSYKIGLTLPVYAPSVDFDTAASLIRKAPQDTDNDRIYAALALTGSLGGARPKAYVWLQNGEFATRETPGSSAWIVKFPAANDGPEIGAVEFAYSLMAKAAGIDVPLTQLLPSAEGAGFFAVKRFDRGPDNKRLHMHSFGGILNAPMENALGYKELMRVTGEITKPSGNDVECVEEQMRRMAFNVLARNRDDHVKNHAFLMDESGRWSCAPAFDLTFSNLQEHALLVGEASKNPVRTDMLEVARSAFIPDDKTNFLIDRVLAAVKEWPTYAKQAGVSPSLTSDIEKAIEGKPSNNNLGAALRFSRSQGNGF